MEYQLDLFMTKEECEKKEILDRLAKVESSCNRVRKGQFAKLGELKGLFLDIDARLKVIEAHLCRDQKTQRECEMLYPLFERIQQ